MRVKGGVNMINLTLLIRAWELRQNVTWDWAGDDVTKDIEETITCLMWLRTYLRDNAPLRYAMDSAMTPG